MKVSIPKPVVQNIKEASTALGLTKQQVVERAVLTYLDSLRGLLKLEKEFAAWDKLSDEALLNFERKLNG